jgi:GNAT superfamily N-acetyltransferase
MTPSADLVAEQADAAAWRAAGEDLLDLLGDAVADGASLGFVGPFDRARARADWLDPVARSLGAGGHRAWLARDDRGIVATVLLAFAGKQNAPHRAEVQKLIVHRRARRIGLGARLMAALETTARAEGRWLLVLDTDEAAASVAFYRALGWQEAGVIPAYSLTPAGVPKGTRFFYKDLREAAA